MLTKEEFTRTHPDIRPGLKVYDRNNEKLGEIEDLGDQGFVVGKGWLLPKFSTIPYDDILEIRDDRVIISRESREMEGWQRAETEDYEGIGQRPSREEESGFGEERARRETEEANIPVREEQLEAEKREREGEVRIHKDVYTETEHMEVPVQKEEVIVEHVPVEEGRSEELGGEEFREEEIRIPVREEEVEVSKRPVTKGEVRARKERRTEPEEVSGEVRKESVRVERDEPAKKNE